MTDHPPPGVTQHERALEHRRIALDAMSTPDDYGLDIEDAIGYATVHALLAVQASFDELTSWALRLVTEIRGDRGEG